MKSQLLFSIIVLGFATCGTAYAQITKPPGGGGIVGNPYASDCAQGFTKNNASGDPNGAHTFHCMTPLIYCPAPPAGFTLGMTDESVPAGKNRVQYRYMCQYYQTGTNPPPK